MKDYGGIGGLKTVSVRSLGANHTNVSYDGITISDCQSGQIDIGRFSLDNVDMLTLSNGQSDKIFQSARLFASASSLNIITQKPVFDKNPVNGKISLKGGSFGLINPSALLNIRLNKTYSINLNGEWLYADGDYPYKMMFGNQNDSISNERRKNTDVNNLRLEASIYADLSDKSDASVQAYYYSSERGLPGATIFYNTDNFSSQRIWDETYFIQANYNREFNRKLSVKANAKYNYAWMK